MRVHAGALQLRKPLLCGGPATMLLANQKGIAFTRCESSEPRRSHRVEATDRALATRAREEGRPRSGRRDGLGIQQHRTHRKEERATKLRTLQGSAVSCPHEVLAVKPQPGILVVEPDSPCLGEHRFRRKLSQVANSHSSATSWPWQPSAQPVCLRRFDG